MCFVLRRIITPIQDSQIRRNEIMKMSVLPNIITGSLDDSRKRQVQAICMTRRERILKDNKGAGYGTLRD
jgi:hypothetical protein